MTRTKELNLASYLLAKNHPFVGLEDNPAIPRQKFFVFDLSTAELDRLEDEFHAGGQVTAIFYAAAMQRLKRLLNTLPVVP